MQQTTSPTNRPVPTDVCDAVAERFIVRAIAYATGHSNPFSTTFWSSYSEYWPGVVKAWITDIDPTRPNLGKIFDLCEAREAQLDTLISAKPRPVLDHAVDQIARVLAREEAWAALFRLALYAQRTPAICLALDCIEYADLDTLAECFSYVLQVPPGDIEIALQRFDDSRPEGASSLREVARPPSWIIQLIRAG